MAKYASVYRVNHTQKFTQIDNRIIENTNLTFGARFLLIFLLKFSPDDNFKFSYERISKKAGISFSKTRALVKELQDAGYVKLTRMKDGNLYGFYHWDVYEESQISLEPIVISNTEYNFNRLWDSYPTHRRGDRKEAIKAFNGIPEVNDNIEDILNGLNEMKGNDNWVKDDGKWIPGLKKFLDNRIWIEGLENPSSTQGWIEKCMEVYKNAQL